MSSNNLSTRSDPKHALGFNARYIYSLAAPESFMNDEQIAHWIDSVSSFLQDWYDHCLSKPENQHHLQTVRDNVDALIKDMHAATHEQHDLARQDNKIVYCPSNNLLLAKSSGSLGFRHYTAATVCLIARYGIRGGKFATREDERGWHLPATMLLVCIIVDLKDGVHFASQFKKNAQANADAKARQNTLVDSAVATLARQLHALTMQSDNGFRPEDEQIEAMSLGLSSIKLSQG